MHIKTTAGNRYTYLHRTNEIVEDSCVDSSFLWRFKPLESFSNMPDVDMFIIGITEQCNLRCKYCCYSGRYIWNRTHSSKSMNESDIEAIYDFIRKFAQKPPLKIAFYGGEPMIHYPLIQKAIQLAENLWDNVSFPITTNGTLLAPDKIDWLIDHNVELTISIDGSQKYNDENRVDTQENGTFHRIKEAIAYIKRNHPDYINELSLQMTLGSFNNLDKIAREWNDDDVLYDIVPDNIHGVASNFKDGVTEAKYEDVRALYLKLLDIYQTNPRWLVLRTFFEQIVDNWGNRPIMEVQDTVPMATCLPLNRKLFIDCNLDIGVCEKMADSFRIGSVKDGIDWGKANKSVSDYYHRRNKRCEKCEAVRFCKMCLTAMEHNETQWNTLCHNERVYAKAEMFIFCEMAERGMI